MSLLGRVLDLVRVRPGQGVTVERPAPARAAEKPCLHVVEPRAADVQDVHIDWPMGEDERVGPRDRVIADIETVLCSLRDDLGTRGLAAEVDIMMLSSTHVRVRMWAGESDSLMSAWAFCPRNQGTGLHIERIEEIDVADLASESELFYIVALMEIRARFAGTMGA